MHALLPTCGLGPGQVRCIEWGIGRGLRPAACTSARAAATLSACASSSLARRHPRLKPNRALYKALIAALRANGALGHALQVYDSMRKEGHAPDNSDFQELTAGGSGSVRGLTGCLVQLGGRRRRPQTPGRPVVPVPPHAAAAEAALSRDDSALQEQVASACNVTSCEVVDLHGMSVCEARAAVLCVLSMLQQVYRQRGTLTHDLTIITGRGEHSETPGKPVVRGAIIRMLQAELQMRSLCVDDDAAAAGGARGGNANPGRVVVERETLLAWCQLRCPSGR